MDRRTSTRRIVERSTALAAPAADVFAHATAMHRINEEMGPWLHMTFPREAESLTLADAAPTLGEPLFASWVLFLRVLPVTRMHVRIVELGPGHRFVEESRMTFMRLWRHERVVVPEGDGCRVTDRLTIEPQIPVLASPLAAGLRAFFGHRHRALANRFGRLPSG